MEQEDYISLIHKDLTEELESPEKKRLDRFLEASEDNRAFYDEIRFAWELSEGPVDLEDLDVEADLKTTRLRIQEERPEAPIVPMAPRRNFIRIAASLLALVGLGTLLWNTLGRGNSYIVAESGSLQFTLPDGSTGILMKGSSIEYEEEFSNDRELTLNGTASFAVEHDPTRPFSINVGDAEVQVLGTKFTVSEQAERIWTTVKEGRVAFSRAGGRVELTAGQVGESTSRDTAPAIRSISTANLDHWQKGQFRFAQEPLSSVIHQLEWVYGIKVIISDDSMQNCLVSGIFNETKADVILEQIARKFDMEFDQVSEKDFTLDKGTCR